VFLGEHDRLYCGEISSALWGECGGARDFDTDGGWFIVLFNPKPMLIAKCGDQDTARSFIEAIAWLAREAGVPTVAKTLGSLKS
jgi:hypothetical protein